MRELLDTREQRYLAVLFLIAITLAVFWRTFSCDFIRLYDDCVYVIDNPTVQKGLTLRGLSWAFITTNASNWHPLTWLSHMTDCQLYRLDPMGHHLTSLLLHLANVLLLFLVLSRMTGYIWRSAFVAALFGIHPLHVESVAWIAERKDILSTLFLLLTMWAYVFYAERPSLKRYLPVVMFFALGLMAKPMLVTLPFMLLLMDYWPLGRLQSADRRLQRLILEKIPLFVLSAASCAVTLYAQHKGGAVNLLTVLPLGARAANALSAYMGYILKMIWPQNLAFFYPHPYDTLPTWQVAGSGLLLVLISVLVFIGRRRPYLPMGWLWYLVILVPVIGLVQVGDQAMADRYTYVPLIGLFIIVAWGVPDLLNKSPCRRIAMPCAFVLAGAAILCFMISAWIQVGFWRNDIALYERAVKSTSGNYLAHNNLGVALAVQGKFKEAIPHYSEALKIYPYCVESHTGLGIALARLGRHGEAITEFREAIRMMPDSADAHYQLSITLKELGCARDAAREYQIAMRLKKFDPAKMCFNRGVLFESSGDVKNAIQEYWNAIYLDPDFAEARSNLGILLVDQGKIDDAIKEYLEALRINPKLDRVHNNLAKALYLKGDYAGAWREVYLCEKYGGSPHPEFLEALSREIPRPKSF